MRFLKIYIGSMLPGRDRRDIKITTNGNTSRSVNEQKFQILVSVNGALPRNPDRTYLYVKRYRLLNKRCRRGIFLLAPDFDIRSPHARREFLL